MTFSGWYSLLLPKIWHPLLLICVALIYSSWVTYRIYSCGLYSNQQLKLQLAFVWLVPYLGALVFQAFYWQLLDESRKNSGPRIESENHWPQESPKIYPDG